jgi:hypothetical protein
MDGDAVQTGKALAKRSEPLLPGGSKHQGLGFWKRDEIDQGDAGHPAIPCNLKKGM